MRSFGLITLFYTTNCQNYNWFNFTQTLHTLVMRIYQKQGSVKGETTHNALNSMTRITKCLSKLRLGILKEGLISLDGG